MAHWDSTKKAEEREKIFNELISSRGKGLKPVKNLRRTQPRCCSRCKFIEYDGEGGGQCVRPGSEWLYTQELEDYEYVCDRFKSERQ